MQNAKSREIEEVSDLANESVAGAEGVKSGRGRKPGTKLEVFDCTPNEKDSEKVKQLKEKYASVSARIAADRVTLAKIKTTVKLFQESENLLSV